MELEDYLEGLREGEFSDPGEFTVAVERARALLAGRSLTDVWLAWLCVAQGLIASGTRSLQIEVTRRSVTWRTNFVAPRTVMDLLKDERFFIGWLNLGEFGFPEWLPEEGVLTLDWRGNPWQRYRATTVLETLLRTTLAYAPIPITLGGASLPSPRLPVHCALCLYPLPEGRPGGLSFEDAAVETVGPHERRHLSLEALGPLWDRPPGPKLAAFASRTKRSWSEVMWVSGGVVISHERNTLERPGLALVACVDALGLQTDLSGFSVVNDDAYVRFTRKLKYDVLWMV